MVPTWGLLDIKGAVDTTEAIERAPLGSSVPIIKSVLFGRNANEFIKATARLLSCLSMDL